MSITTTSTPVDFQLAKSIAIILEAKNIHCTEEFLFQLTDLTASYFHDIANTLRECTHLQRRQKPTISDVQLFLRLHDIHTTALIDQVQATKKSMTPKIKQQVEDVQKQTIAIRKALDSENADVDDDSPSLPFFSNESYQIAELVPREVEQPQYIPSYFPDLPPDYTYRNTPKYMKTVTDLKELRLKLVEESRLTEKSLYDLIEDEERVWRKNLEKEIQTMEDADSSDNNSIMSDTPVVSEIETPLPDEIVLNIEAHEPQPKDPTLQQSETQTQPEMQAVDVAPLKEKPVDTNVFDIVAYAEKRRQILITRDEKLIAKRKLHENNIYIKAERVYSPYATEKRTAEVDTYFKGAIQDEFKSAIKAVRLAEASKKRKIEAILKGRANLQKKKEAENVQFDFQFNGMNQMLDEDSDEENLGNEQFPDFDFVSTQPKSNIDISSINEHVENEAAEERAAESTAERTASISQANEAVSTMENSSAMINASQDLVVPLGATSQLQPEDRDTENGEVKEEDNDDHLSDDFLEAELENAMRNQEDADPSVPQLTAHVNSESDDDDFDDL